MPGAHRTTNERKYTTAGLIAATLATLIMMAWAIFPSAAFATNPLGTQRTPTNPTRG